VLNAAVSSPGSHSHLPVITTEIQFGFDIIGWLIRERRIALGLTQAALERASGVDQTTISRLERGRLPALRFVRLACIVAALEGHGPGRAGAEPSMAPLPRHGRPSIPPRPIDVYW
jgi:DNA-binding XRE family transcriptional regulator